jgi:branched-chain amino acid transport system ATP-binding protein
MNAIPMLEVSGVHTFYGNIEALKGVDVMENEGEIVTLIGANGAGKSTLLMTICGNPRAASGRIAFCGDEITGLPTYEIVRRGVAQSPEGRRVFPRMTVLENLQIGATVADDRHFDDDLARVFKLFPVLDERRNQRSGTLSGGEQQMLAIGRALMSRPRLLLLDEPSLGLAPRLVRQIFEVIREINERENVTIFLVEQNAFHALRLAHRAYVMANGRILMSGTGAELLANDDIRAAYLEGGARKSSVEES